MRFAFDSVGSTGSACIDRSPRRLRLAIIIGIVLLIIGFIAAVPIIWSIGFIVLVIGLVFMIFGALGHAIGGRRHIY